MVCLLSLPVDGRKFFYCRLSGMIREGGWVVPEREAKHDVLKPKIAVVGLGPGDPGMITAAAWKRLEQAAAVYVRTKRHPAVRGLAERGIAFVSFDPVYETAETFEAVYQTIAEALTERANSLGAEIVYAVPGHPSVAERSVVLLKERCAAKGVELEIVGGISFLDEAFARLGFDPVEGFLLLDAFDLRASRLCPELHIVIAQVCDRMTASHVKLALMERYPDDYRIVVARSLGVEGEEQIERMPLYELDRLTDYGDRTLVWVPKADNAVIGNRSFERLREIVAILRGPDGCPWDRKQTHASLRRYLVEETYETIEAIDADDPDALREELGDLLLQVMLHAQIESETGAFDVYDVIAALNDKLIRRHPHVFGDVKAADADEALRRWESAKAAEKDVGDRLRPTSVLDGVPRELPTLYRALRFQEKAASVGFDWPDVSGALDKLREELGELEEACRLSDAARVRDELGDVLFAAVNVARFFGADPDEALARAVRKFVHRFSRIEEAVKKSGRRWDEVSLEEMDAYWRDAKKLERPT